MVTSLEKFVFASHLRKPKIRNKAHDFPKPINSKTLLISDTRFLLLHGLFSAGTERNELLYNRIFLIYGAIFLIYGLFLRVWA